MHLEHIPSYEASGYFSYNFEKQFEELHHKCSPPMGILSVERGSGKFDPVASLSHICERCVQATRSVPCYLSPITAVQIRADS